jgi:hypothetical protein
MKTNCRGFRDVTTVAGTERFAGFVSADPASDVIRRHAHPGWINLDGRLGIVFRGTGETVYHNRHHFPTWWATADDLVLSRIDRPRRVKAGAEIARLAALITPGQPAKKTATTVLREITAPPGCAALIGADHLAAANFGVNNVRAKLRTTFGIGEHIPIFPGTTRIAGQNVAYHLTLPPARAVLHRAVCHLLTTGPIEVVATDTTVLAGNTGSSAASLTIGRKTVKLKTGQWLQLA